MTVRNQQQRRKRRRLMNLLTGGFLALSIVALIALALTSQQDGLTDAYALAQETADFLQTSCQQYDNYDLGSSAKSLQNILDKALGMTKFLAPEDLQNNDFLLDFIRTEHLSGVIVVDEHLNMLAQANMDGHRAFATWKPVLALSAVRDTMEHPQKAYLDHITLDGTGYDFAVVPMAEPKGLVLCYTSTYLPNSDPYELSIDTFLVNNSFHKNPTVIITDGSAILSSNNNSLEGTAIDDCPITDSSISWATGHLTYLQYNGQTWYGLRRAFNRYYIYVLYPSGELFSGQTSLMAVAFMVYLALCVVLLLLQRHSDKRNLEATQKQLGIIQAISTSYASTFLLHLDRRELEPIQASPELESVYQRHSQPEEFLSTLIREHVSPTDHHMIAEFLDMGTMGERMRDHPFLGVQVRDLSGTWYSILLIPQKTDESGNVLSVLAATRDVTDIKRNEELSIKDQLTGLYNRNFLELHARAFLAAGPWPVSLIMGDCNYLKTVNDTMGHEYGNLMLRRVARAITDCLPSSAIAIRSGGDEFLILIRGCTHEAAEAMVGAIRRHLIRESDDFLHLSVAFGIYTTDDPDFSMMDACNEADRNMYRDKAEIKQHEHKD